MQRNPIAALELLGWFQTKVIKNIHNNGMELTNQQWITVLTQMAGLVETLTREEKKTG